MSQKHKVESLDLDLLDSILERLDEAELRIELLQAELLVLRRNKCKLIVPHAEYGFHAKDNKE